MTSLVVFVALVAWACGPSPGPSAGGPRADGDCSCADPDCSSPGSDARCQPPECSGTGDLVLDADPVVPCIEVVPQQIKFGGKKVGDMATLPLEIRSCGDVALEIRGIELTTDTHPSYGLDLGVLAHTPAEDNPVVVPPGEGITVLVTYVPECPEPVDEGGDPPAVVGMIVIRSNASPEEKLVEVGGFGALTLCPEPVITCAEGGQVRPGTELHLSGEDSWVDPCIDEHEITKWNWSVVAPIGSQARFEPSADVEAPTFRVDLVGKYTFALAIYDEQNIPSCALATWEVVVVPDDAVWVELFWETPGDPDETDTGPAAGADLDLHLVHPLAGGPDLDVDGQPDGWFDQPFDCFWFNANPEWGSSEQDGDDPILMVNDTDGAGPEAISLNSPENVTYKVGVHCWDDHGYGASYATVRVYVYSQLVFEIPDVKLVDSDMWEVCTIEWPSGKVQVVTDGPGQYKITPGYQNPFFFQD
ncbi:MAG: hypothetical protein ABIK09_03990 [Pseudomonadota bacterium]